MNLALLRAFVAILDEGSISRAAVRLGMTQPALSRQVQALETELGGALLERTPRGVLATPAGERFARRARVLVAELDEALAEARRSLAGHDATIRLGSLQSLSPVLLTPVLGDLRAAHPDIKVRLFDLSPGEQIAELRAGRIDVALVGEEGAVLGRDFYARSLARLPLAVALAAGHPLAARGSLAFADLADERFVASPDEDVPGRDRRIAALARRAGFRPRWTGPAGTVTDLMQRVAEGEGIAILPSYLREPGHPGVAFRILDDPDLQWDLLVVWQRGRTPPGVHHLLDALARRAKVLEPEAARG